MQETLRILLAEDNPADAFLVQEALSLVNLSFHVTRAADGEKASQILDQIERDKSVLDLILLDLNLPKVSGHELLAKVRNGEHLCATPVIIMTSSDSPQDRARTAALQISYYFRKPTELTDFLQLGKIVKSVHHNFGRKPGEREADA